MKKLLLLLSAVILTINSVRSQGCIVVRNISGFGQFNLTDNSFTATDWQINVTGRYFKSFRDFNEKEEVKPTPGNESVNHVYSLDMTFTKMLSRGWALSLSVPVTANDRTTTIEHGGLNTKRRTTRSFGMGDIRFTAFKWLLKPSVRQKGNIQVGVGIKLPTGDYKYQDYFYRNDSTRILSSVNPSIQLGDGGTGFTTELNTFYYLNPTKTLTAFGNFYYLFNPRDLSGTQYTTGRPITTLQTRTGGADLSVPDVFLLRAGVYLNHKKWGFSGAIRSEGTPVNDVFGESNGVRRAGHNVSVEPGIVYKARNSTFYFYVPVIVDRRIRQNVSEKIETELTGNYVNRVGGFAEYLVFVGVLFKL